MKELSSLDESVSKPDRASHSEYNSLRAIEERLLTSTDAREVVLWTGVRKEIIRQNESLEKPKHKRNLETVQIYFKMSFSLVAFVTGVILLIYGFTLLAPLIIGAGLFSIAPDFVMAYFNRSKGERDE
jgi:hypothetical protein